MNCCRPAVTTSAGAQASQDAAEALRRADDARRARGRLARLLAAWRGE
jgi:hypothetical protein